MMHFSNKAQEQRYLAAQVQYLKQLAEGWDVVLAPEEQAPLFATENTSADNANWAIDYLVTDALLDKVIKTAKEKKSGPILIEILDTAPAAATPVYLKYRRYGTQHQQMYWSVVK